MRHSLASESSIRCCFAIASRPSPPLRNGGGLCREVTPLKGERQSKPFVYLNGAGARTRVTAGCSRFQFSLEIQFRANRPAGLQPEPAISPVRWPKPHQPLLPLRVATVKKLPSEAAFGLPGPIAASPPQHGSAWI